MASQLSTYHRKRHFQSTPEPRGRSQRSRGALRFVVQKHQASHLHYDFRLELDGTLKSWAVPKGPSLDPDVKRLAMKVEDHPLEYRKFEGTIPEGNYGAGTVMIWDEGTYHAAETNERRDSERLLREGLRKGRLRFVLHGRKLTGEFSLVKLASDPKNAWLLIKKPDRSAWASEVIHADRSIVSDRTLEEIAAGGSPPPRRRSLRLPKKIAISDAPRRRLDGPVKPMLPSLVDEPFDRAGWIFELKWDGYRAIAEVSRQGVSLYSRNHKAFEHRFAPIVQALRDLGHEAVLDGEIVVVDSRGKADFQLLQNYQATGEGDLRYYVFDLLHLDGHDLRRLPLHRRKQLLAQILGELPGVFLSEHVKEQGTAFFKAAASQGLEGIIAKDAQSPYRPGVRSHEWLKIKTHRRQEAIICGFTEPRGSRKNLGALVLGLYENRELIYIGHTGGGLNAGGLSDLRSRLEPLIQRRCPFRKEPKTNAPVHWVAPKLVCEVKFQEWTQDGVMRQPIFLGLREDKAPRAVHREQAGAAAIVLSEHKVVSHRPRAMPSAERRRRPATAPRSGLPEPQLTHLDKLYWPEKGYTKGDLIAYYREVAPVLLPYLHDRPESLHRHPNGIASPSFYQKDVSRQPPPPWVTTTRITPESGGKAITYLVCQDEPTLLYLANLGCIELNPWNARIASLPYPDYVVLDLDPQDIPFQAVVDAAQVTHTLLEEAGAASVCKTSGKRGLHVFVPLGARYTHEQARQFAEIVAHLVHQQLPNSTSVVRNPALRRGQVYLDFLQNRIGQTVAAPYSVRPRPGATVSTPLRWSEVKRGLDPARFTIETLPRRLDKVGDLWKPVLRDGVDLPACLERLARAQRSK